MTDYLIYFVNHGDPNGPSGGGLIPWPSYDTQNRRQLAFLDGDLPLSIIPDDYRSDGFASLIDLSLKFPL